MGWNGSGVYSLPALYFPEAPGNLVDSDRYNGTLNDIATGLNAALTKNGQNSATANLPMGGFKHTGAAAGTVSGEYFLYGQGFGNGTAALPSVYFTSDPDTGMYRYGANQIGFSVNGADLLVLGAASSTIFSSLYAAGLQVPNGSAASPTFFFQTDSDTGFYLSGANTIGFTAAGAQVGYWDPTALVSYGNITLSGAFLAQPGNASAPGYSFATDPDTGVFRVSANVLGVAVGGVKIAEFSATGFSAENVLSGTYTPTVANQSNITAVTPQPAMWSRVGNVVTVSGEVAIQPASAASAVFSLSLPYAVLGVLGETYKVAGTFNVPSADVQGRVRGSGLAATQVAWFQATYPGTSNYTCGYIFQFLIE